MPCRYDDDTSAAQYGECLKELDKTTRILCEVMDLLFKATDYEPTELSQEAQIWWKNHQEKDAIRKKKEEEARQIAIDQAEKEVELHGTKYADAKRRLDNLKKSKT